HSMINDEESEMAWTLSKQWVAVPVAALLLLGACNTAEAKGCIKGAAVGAVAGHVARHHAVMGAVAGCVVGHHLAKKKEREEKERRRQEQRQLQPAAPSTAT
ncbi:MAG TPA: hypothetical protein VN735_02115, partial [Steroidobacteraceae bacterium]|nr:hypothetical protein [Steroidobacteraceae bacterium]